MLSSTLPPAAPASLALRPLWGRRHPCQRLPFRVPLAGKMPALPGNVTFPFIIRSTNGPRRSLRNHPDTITSFEDSYYLCGCSLHRASTAIHRVWHACVVGVTPQQFEAMRERVGGERPAGAKASKDDSTLIHDQPAKIILGIDPSLRGTGLGIIDGPIDKSRVRHFEVLRCPAKWERSRCLARIAEATRMAIRRHSPEVCVVESLFYAQNLQTALIMGEARGACLAAVAECGLAIYELAPRRVKQAIVGYGAAGKDAVARMVQRMLNLDELPPDDAADALALALVFSQEQKRFHLRAPKRI